MSGKLSSTVEGRLISEMSAQPQERCGCGRLEVCRGGRGEGGREEGAAPEAHPVSPRL